MSIVQDLGARTWDRPRAVAHVDLAAHGHARVSPTLRRWERSYRARTFTADFGSALIGAATGAFVVGFIATDRSTDEFASWATAVAVAAGWPVVLAIHSAYATRYIGAGNEEYRAVTRATGTLLALLACAAFLGGAPFSRTAVLIAVPTMMVLTLLGRWVLRRRLAWARVAGRFLQPTLLVGDPRAVLDMAERIAADPGSVGMAVVGACTSDPRDPGVEELRRAGIRVLGGPDDIIAAVERGRAQAVAVASNSQLSGESLRRLGWNLEQQDVDLLISPGIVGVAGPRLSLRPDPGLPMLHVERPVASGLRYGVKLLADRICAVVLLVLAAPVLLGIAMIIKLDSPGPVLFTQQRVGGSGHTFRMFKFRTMCADAEARLGELGTNDGNAVLFKLREDPRITRVGTWLRRFSIDELPQLLNVVRGDMSLVGPRPPLPSEVDRYESDAVRRLRVRPGMTGLWQVSGRSDLSWGDSVRLDLWYVDNWSLALDAQILVRTASAVARGRGAY
jgi:exopolysaccharide biosynthesis polyprenyl glycosylphosphotransferase